ncbi:chemotaxis protein CheB [Actinoplanes philippinensis]|uniref:chemotaxis protein CheB n=1 Tax=Actinoplanes philippinensis TaxID=35752 RepID=UPI0033F58623
MREAGGLVVAQSPDSAEFASMPKSAAGSAHLVLPLGHIGGVLADMARGRPLPRPRSEIEAAAALFRGPGEVERLLRAKDWPATPLGPVTEWPEVLRAVVRITLDSGFPAAVWWGPELIQLYNESWRQFLGSTKHPQALAGRADQTWPELWSFVGPMIEDARVRGVASGAENMPMLMDRNGSLEEVFVTFTYSPITDDRGTVLGIQNSILDTTATMIAERRMGLLRAVATETAGARTPSTSGSWPRPPWRAAPPTCRSR